MSKKYSSPLYCTGITLNGIVLLGGAFKFEDEYGMPIDTTFDLCKEKGVLIDWCEYLADSGSQRQWKFDYSFKKMENLLGTNIAQEILYKYKILATVVMQKFNLADSFISINMKIVEFKKENQLKLELLKELFNSY